MKRKSQRPPDMIPERQCKLTDAVQRKCWYRSPRLLLLAVYFLGCLLLYSGISGAALDFWGTHEWSLKPEPDLFKSLVEAAITLIRPVLAVVLTFWDIAIVPGVIWGFWIIGADGFKRLKRLLKRN